MNNTGSGNVNHKVNLTRQQMCNVVMKTTLKTKSQTHERTFSAQHGEASFHGDRPPSEQQIASQRARPPWPTTGCCSLGQP